MHKPSSTEKLRAQIKQQPDSLTAAIALRNIPQMQGQLIPSPTEVASVPRDACHNTVCMPLCYSFALASLRQCSRILNTTESTS